MTNDNLHYRRQFLLTPEVAQTFGHWQHLAIGVNHLYAHPELELSSLGSTDSSITVVLVGYIINPHKPEQSNTDILGDVLKIAGSFDEISDHLHSLSGRFVLIIHTPDETLLFHDPCGLRTVYYVQNNEKLYVASQPNLFKQVLPLENGERISSYFSSAYVEKDLEHWIPSGCSLYEQVYHLVPNHALRFSTIEQTRYWPKREILERPVVEVVKEASELLSNLIAAASKRFELALPMTAGWDSRLLLSASKNIANEIYYYTLQYRKLNPTSKDIKLPGKLLRFLGQHHNVIDCRRAVPEEFCALYENNVSLAHMNDWGKIAYGMTDAYPQERVCLKGNCSEIMRCFYYKYGSHKDITSPEQLIAMEKGWGAIPFICDQITSWFDDACEASSKAEMDILDLFYWEHRMGSWQAQGQLEWDIVQETFTPFNHRGLIELMLSVPTKYRCAPNYSLYKMMMKTLWPDVLEQPINPSPKDVLRSSLQFLGYYKIINKTYKFPFTKHT